VLVAMLGAIVYAYYGLSLLFSSAVSVLADIREYLVAPPGSSGLGAVSFGLTALVLPYFLLGVASIVASVMLASWARASDQTVKRLHRAHRWSIVFPLVWILGVIAEMVAFNVGHGPAWLGFVWFSLSGAVWGVQFVLTAALIGVYAVRHSRA